VGEALKLLKGNPFMEYAELNYIVTIFHTPNDPQLPNQWDLRNADQTIQGVSGTFDSDTDALEAWNSEDGSAGQPMVAVIDTGIDPSHPELDSKIVPGYNWFAIFLTSSVGYFNCGSDANSQMVAQSITGTGQALTHAGFRFRKISNPTSEITVSVRSSLAGSDLASFSISASEGGYSLTEVYKEFSNSVTLQNGTTYFLVISINYLNTSNYYQYLITVGMVAAADKYAGGEQFVYNEDPPGKMFLIQTFG